MIKATLAILLLTAGTAQAGLRNCAYEQGHNRANAHRDIGGGFVTYEQSYLTQGTGAAQYVLENCSTGVRLITVMNDYKDGGVDRTKDVRTTFDTMIRSDQQFSPRDVRNKMRSMGANSELSSWDKQSCACAAAYPELRGTRKPFKE